MKDVIFYKGWCNKIGYVEYFQILLQHRNHCGLKLLVFFVNAPLLLLMTACLVNIPVYLFA